MIQKGFQHLCIKLITLATILWSTKVTFIKVLALIIKHTYTGTHTYMYTQEHMREKERGGEGGKEGDNLQCI